MIASCRLRLVLLFLLFTLHGARAEPARTSILADTGGALEEVVIQYAEAMAAESVPVFESFVSQLENDTAVYIVCENDEQAVHIRRLLATWEVPNRRLVTVTNAEMEISGWARDRFVVAEDGDSGCRTALLPAIPPDEDVGRRNDVKVPSLIARSTPDPINTKQSGYFFEGGNLVSSDHFVFTGYDTIIGMGIEGEKRAVTVLEEEFGKRLVVLGSEDLAEPHAHVDMYLTPLSDCTVLLGDPAWGETLARRDPAFAVHEKLLVLEEDLEGLEPDEEGEWDSMLPDDSPAAWAQVLGQLVHHGFEVQRIPLVEDHVGNVITYNNVVMEERGDKRIVYMPVYGIPTLDVAAMRKYRSLGFEVRSVDVSEVYRLGGTIRCLTNVLARRTPSHTTRHVSFTPPALFHEAGACSPEAYSPGRRPSDSMP